jgi:hypothetical protein
MSIPSTSIYVRPGWTSYTWTYGGATSDTGAAITAVAFDLSSIDGQQLARGSFQYSVDGGRTWNAYAVPTDQAGSYIATAGTLWRFADTAPNDNSSLGTFTMHWQLADGGVVSTPAAVVVDAPPAGAVADRDTVFTTAHVGDAVATLAPIDSGAPDGGRWVIDSQSASGLFSIVPSASGDGTATLVVANPGALPASGAAVTVDVHYFDRYQLDTNGNPIPTEGASQVFNFNVVDGASQDLAGFGPDLSVGTSTDALHAGPALASLSGGGFVTVWQGPSPGGVGVWAQLRDASGSALEVPFAIADQSGITEGQPAVAALSGGRFVVAYSLDDGSAAHIAYRIVDANGAIGAQHVADSSVASDTAMPTVATLADGSFVVGWRAGGQVHTLQASGADGTPLGAEHVTGTLGSAFSPSVVALDNGSYATAWGEIGDGNVYVSVGSSGAPTAVTTDGAAASISTAAPLPHVAALAGGGFVVAWDSYSNDQRGFTISDIFFQRYDDAGNKVGDTVQANVDSGSGRYDASVAALSDGGFVVTWQAHNGDFDGNGIFGRRFGHDGSANDVHEFEVNQMRQGDQASPAVTGLTGDGFATVWVDTQASGSATIETRVMNGTGTAQQGESFQAPVTGSSGNDRVALGSGSHHVDGGTGLDTASYNASSAAYKVAHTTDGFNVTANDGSTIDSLVNVERIQFSDTAVALDINGTAGEAYRLYQAAFDRAPDKVGLGYWINAMDHGASLEQVAAAFWTSKEFQDLYGANTSDAQFVTLLYQNVLHRAPEASGYDFWVDSLSNHHVPRETVLGNFSESPENQAQVIGSIQDGIHYTPWGG